jgi:uncharacterized protein (DUF2236 family)
MNNAPDADRVLVVEQKVDALAASVATLSTSVDRRFGEVTQHFVELREYIEFGLTQLDQKMRTMLDQKTTALDQKMTTRFDRLERKVDQLIEAQVRSRRRRPRRKP